MLRRIWSDVRAGRNLDTYVVTVIVVVFAALGVVGDVVPDGLKWSAVFAGLGILLLRMALPPRPAATTDSVLVDREAFVNTPFSSRLRNAKQVWIFAPSAINLLSTENCTALREFVLDKGSGDVRIAVLDPGNTAAVDLAIRHLDAAAYPLQSFREVLATSVKQLRKMAGWTVAGNFTYRFADYNPGFGLVAINPSHRDGRIIVEFHGYGTDSIGSRMHISLTRADSDHWFQYWLDQFEQLWKAARTPDRESS